jgi:predicted nucleotidyltransferase
MIAEVQDKAAELVELCRRFRVRRLGIFGSAATGEFDLASSDLDFLVEHLELEAGHHADAYFGLLAALEDLFHRRIDLVMTETITNPYFLQAVDRTRRLLYAA